MQLLLLFPILMLHIPRSNTSNAPESSTSPSDTANQRNPLNPRPGLQWSLNPFRALAHRRHDGIPSCRRPRRSIAWGRSLKERRNNQAVSKLLREVTKV